MQIKRRFAIELPLSKFCLSEITLDQKGYIKPTGINYSSGIISNFPYHLNMSMLHGHSALHDVVKWQPIAVAPDLAQA